MSPHPAWIGALKRRQEEEDTRAAELLIAYADQWRQYSKERGSVKAKEKRQISLIGRQSVLDSHHQSTVEFPSL